MQNTNAHVAYGFTTRQTTASLPIMDQFIITNFARFSIYIAVSSTVITVDTIDTSMLIYYINTRTVCVCMSISCEISGIERRITALLLRGAKIFSWQVAQTAFRAYTKCGSRGKLFGAFR